MVGADAVDERAFVEECQLVIAKYAIASQPQARRKNPSYKFAVHPKPQTGAAGLQPRACIGILQTCIIDMRIDDDLRRQCGMTSPGLVRLRATSARS